MSELTQSAYEDLYYYMRLTRAAEERLESLFRQGRVVGGLYRSLGQEGASVGAAYALEKYDWFTPAIRNLGAMLVRGIGVEQMFLQYMGRADSPTRGRDNTTHFNDPSIGFLGPISPLGTTLCVAAGLALAIKMRAEERAVLAFLGDGGSRTGAAHEGISFATARRLPLVVVVENNGWAFGTRTSEQAALESFAEMGAGYGIPGSSVDGNDVLAVFSEVRKAASRARVGGGMSLIEVVTYRATGHAQHDSQDYVPAEELETWRARDPISRYVAWLMDNDLATRQRLTELDGRVERELDIAVERALGSPAPDTEAALENVLAGGPQSRAWTRSTEFDAGIP